MLVVARVLIWIGAAWPIVVIGVHYIPRLARGRVHELYWFLFFVGYMVCLLLAAALHCWWIAERPSWGLLERWLVLGALVCIPVALRSYLKEGHWWMPPRWRSRW